MYGGYGAGVCAVPVPTLDDEFEAVTGDAGEVPPVLKGGAGLYVG